MTRHTVTWSERAIEELTRSRLESSNRKRLGEVVASIDAALLHDPELKGIAFYGDRLLVIPPLAVVFTVRPADRIVEVLVAWHAPRE